jgi:methionyl-tRNA formyltransferase
MVKKMDAGDIAVSLETNIGNKETGGELYNRLKLLAVDATKVLIENIINNKLDFKQQDESHVSFAPTIKKEDGFLDFKNMTYQEIFNKSRAFDPWPGTYCFLNDKRLKVHKVSESNLSLTPGKIETKNGMLVIGCKDKCIRLEMIQLEGKKACQDTELLNGLKEVPVINKES